MIVYLLLSNVFIFFSNNNRNMKIILYIILAIGVVITLNYLLSQTKITVNFSNLEPFEHSIPVYYKGFKLGHTIKVYPGKDFHTTRVDLKLRLQDLKLPDNTTAIVKRKDKRDYIELIYPEMPSINYLKDFSIISGTKGANFESFMQDKAEDGSLDDIKDNLNKTLESAIGTFESITMLVNYANDILKEVRPSICHSAKNLDRTTENLADASESIKKSLENDYIKNTLYNFEITSKNLNTTTKNFSNTSNNFNNESIDLINCVIRNINIVVTNINEIVIGIGTTLKKRFGGIRLIFGKAITVK